MIKDMGLDICVRKIVKTPKNKEDYFRLIDDEGNYDNKDFPEWTKPFESEVVESWYDWKKYKEETGIDINQYDRYSEYYDNNGNFMEIFPKGVEIPEYDEQKYKSWEEYENERNKVIIKIDLDKVPIYQHPIKVLYWEEIGYQRKGLNINFYTDYDDEKIGYFVWSKAELERYKKEYCDEPYEYVYPNGERSGKMVCPKDNFQRNIIDTFTEGEDCVIFSW